MKVLIFWNIILTTALLILLKDYTDRSTAPIHLKEISASSTGKQLTHGSPLPGNGFVSSRVDSSGAIHLTQFLETNADPSEDEPYGVTQTSGENGSSISVSYHDIDGAKSAEGLISATPPQSTSNRNGALLQLSSEGGKGWIELGFNKEGRPFLQAFGAGNKKIWWLLD